MSRYTHAGTSRRNGKLKVRFTNDFPLRQKMMKATGHTDIYLVDYSSEGKFTKLELCKKLLSEPGFQSEEAQSAIVGYVARNVPELRKEKDIVGILAPTKQLVLL